jgi:hypothetical protein
MPFVTAPLALVLFQLSWFPWGLAKWLMTALNVAVALCIPWLVLRSFPHCASLSRQERWLVQLAFYAFVPTRVAVWLGQNTIPVFGLMLVALLVKERSWLLAGICLGLALSKYAVALPLVLLLLLRWRRRHGWMIVTALWVQVSAVVVISLRSGDSPLQLLQDHLEVFLSFAQWTGALGTQLQDIVPEGMPLPVAGVVLAVSVAALLSWWLRRWRRVPADCMPLADYQLWVVLVLSTLLVVYHSDYDVLMTVVFLPLGLYAIRHPSSWGLTPGQTRWLSAVTVMLVGVLILPGSIVSEVLSDAATEQWLGWVGLGVTLTVLVALATAVWLLMRFLRAARQQAPSSGAQARRSRWRA